MRSLSPDFSRKPEEIAKFKSLIRTLLWVQGKTGKPAAEIIKVTFSKGKVLLDQHCW